jgi:hypothetical protein
MPAQANAAGNASGISITLPSSTLSASGTISKPGGTTIANATVKFIDPDSGGYSGIATTDSHGVFRVYDLAHETFLVTIDARASAKTYMPGFYQQSGPNHFTPTSANATKVTYSGTTLHLSATVAKGHSISGELRAQTNNAGLAAMSVSATRVTATGVYPFFVPPITTDAQGRFTVAGLANGSYTISFSRTAGISPNVLGGCFRIAPPHNYSSDCGSASKITINNADATNRNSDLPAGHVVTGAVKDAQGHSLCASLSLSSSTSFQDIPDVLSCGAFTFRGVPSGGYKLTITAKPSTPFVEGSYAGNARHWTEDEESATAINVGAKDVNLGTIQPDKGHTVSGRVTTNAGKPVVGVFVRVAGGTFEYSNTRADGTWVVRGIGSGTHDVSIGGTFGNPANVLGGYYRKGAPGNYTPELAQATELSGNADHTGITMKLPAGYRISGRITNQQTQGVPASVILEGIETFGGIVTTDAGGNYEAVGLAADDYRVSVFPDSAAYHGGYYAKSRPGHFGDYGQATRVHVGP